MIKLLLVEDESGTRKGLMKHMKWNELGVDIVEEAIDGVEGLEAARRMHPDIVVSDIRMPGMNGIEFTSHVRKELPECKIIYLSGYSDVEYLKAAIRNNAVSYVEKPIIMEELQEVIAKAVRLCLENKKMKETFNQMNLALSGSLPFIKHNIVNGLITNRIDEDELTRNLNLAGIRFNPGDAYTVSIVVPSFDENETNDAKQRSLHAMIDFLQHVSNDFTHLAVMKDSAHLLVITAHKPERRKDFPKIYQLLSEHVLDMGMDHTSLTWIVGSTSSELSGISESYAAASENLRFLFNTNHVGTIYYSTDLTSNNQAILDVIHYIRGNYSDKEISVHLLAEHVHLTPTYLSALFKKETGKTISEFITEVRIEKSANLLMEPQSKLYDVAEQSGYSDANYFAKAFKKIKGMTPSQFRSKHKS